ncbi:Toll-like receptor 2 [Mactra antiquata]
MVAIFLLVFVFVSTKCSATLTQANHEEADNLRDTLDSNETMVCDVNGTSVDCSFRGLQYIPENLPGNLTSLNLRANNIKYIKGTSFQRYQALAKLSLSDNSLEIIGLTDFEYVSSLTMLDLSLNKIVYDNINNNAFQNLSKLYYLDLKQRDDVTESTTYPRALEDLDALEYLMVDGFDNYLPHLPNLKELYFSSQYGRCNIPHLRRDIFKNLFNTNITGIYLSKCNIVNVDEGVFENFPRLESLDVSWNENLTFGPMCNITFGLKNYFKRLNTNNIYQYFKASECTVIWKEHVVNLMNTSLEVWTLEGNHIIKVDPNAIYQVPLSLKYISVQDNMLMVGDYSDIIVEHQLLKHVIYYDTSKLFGSHLLPSNHFGKINYSQAPKYTIPHNVLFTRSQIKTYFQVIDERLQKFNITSDKSNKSSSSNQTVTEYLDLSECLSDTYKVMFELFTVEGLRYLNMSKTYLGYTLLDNGTMFERFVSLTTLDISSNGILQLKEHIFDTLHKLERLYIGNNKLSNISFDISPLTNLKYLDLHSNRLETLNMKTMESLSNLKNVTVNIGGNVLRCDCHKQNLKFLVWIATTNVVFEDFEHTLCYFINESSIPIGDLNIESFKLECEPPAYSVLTLVTSFCILIFLMIIGGGLLHRYRWNLRYLYYMTKFKMVGGYQRLDDVEYDKDIFVSYANDDTEFVRNEVIPKLEESGHFSLLVHARDFQAGEFVADNIVRAVTSTRVTLAILTRAYVESKWCMYEMNMASLEGINTNRNVLCVIMKDNIPPKNLPIELIEVLKSKTYIEYPESEEQQEQFWERLITTLK